MFFPRTLLLLVRHVGICLFVTTNVRVFRHFLMMFVTILLRVNGLKRSNIRLFLNHRINLILALILVFLATYGINTLLRKTRARRRGFVRVKTVGNGRFRLLHRQSVLVLTRRRRAAIGIRPTRFAISRSHVLFRDDLLPFSLAYNFHHDTSTRVDGPVPLFRRHFYRTKRNNNLFRHDGIPMLLPMFSSNPNTLFPRPQRNTRDILPNNIRVSPHRLSRQYFAPDYATQPYLPQGNGPGHRHSTRHTRGNHYPRGSLFYFYRANFLRSVMPSFL